MTEYGSARAADQKRRIWRVSTVSLTIFLATFVFFDANWFASQWIPLVQTGATIGTALIILVQAKLLRVQNQVDALINLNERWDSCQMFSIRAAWAKTEGLRQTEAALEFLEEFAALKQRSVLDEELIWNSVLGWYAVHYFIYNEDNGNIDGIRKKWGDDSLYSALQALQRGYLKTEAERRQETTGCIRDRILSKKKDFVADERYRYELCVS